MKKSLTLIAFTTAIVITGIAAQAQNGVPQTDAANRPMIAHDTMMRYPEVSHALMALQGAKNSLDLITDKNNEYHQRALMHINAAIEELNKSLPQPAARQPQ